MKLRWHHTLALLLCLGAPVMAQTFGGTLNGQNNTFGGNLNAPKPGFGTELNNQTGIFGGNLNAELNSRVIGRTLRIPATPEAVQNALLFDRNGRQIEFRMLVDAERGWIIGTPLQGVTFELIQRAGTLGQPESYVLLGYRNGQLISLSPDDIFIGNTNLGNYCGDIGSLADTGIPITVTFVLDVSGSMDDVLPDVRTSLQSFAQQLPLQAQCQLATFTEQLRGHDLRSGRGVANRLPAPASCDLLRDSGLVNQVVQPTRQGTSIASAMQVAYQDSRSRPGEVNFIALITDGADGDDASTHTQMMQTRAEAIAEAGTYTFVNWLGRYAANSPVTQVADSELVGRVAGRPVGQDFFDEAIDRFKKTLIIAPRQCD